MSKHSEIIEKLYKSREKTGDVTFIVDSKLIRAHRCVMAMLSPKYKDQFYRTECHVRKFKVEGVTADAFEEFLQFFYFEKVNLTFKNIGAVMELAEKSHALNFVKECLYFIVQNVKIGNLCSTYQLAISFDIQGLKDLCEREIANNTMELFGTDNFIHCDQATLEHILKLETLNCQEIEIFDVCILWARAACDKKAIDGAKPKNLRDMLGNAIYQIRFGSMTLDEFVERYRKIEGFFEVAEYLEITYMIANLNDFIPQFFNQTPRGFDENLVKIEMVWKLVGFFTVYGILDSGRYYGIKFPFAFGWI